MAIEYSSSTFAGTVSVSGGNNQYPGQPGTLWEPKRFTNAVADITIDTGYQYFFPSTVTEDYYWSLTLANTAVVYFHDFTNATFYITNCLIADNSGLRFDVDSTGDILQTGINNFVLTNDVTVCSDVPRGYGSYGSSLVIFEGCHGISSLTISSNALVNLYEGVELCCVTNIWIGTNASLYLPAGTYDLAGDFQVPTGSILYARGDTNVINEASGGTSNAPHGIGVTINVAGDATIDGTIDADLRGFFGGVDGYPGPAG